jgi:hypothetical protein
MHDSYILLPWVDLGCWIPFTVVAYNCLNRISVSEDRPLFCTVMTSYPPWYRRPSVVAYPRQIYIATEESPATYARWTNPLAIPLQGTHRVVASIIAGGYESFNYRFHTDHLSFYLDFDNKSLFGSPTQKFCKKLACKGGGVYNHAIAVTQITREHRGINTHAPSL